MASFHCHFCACLAVLAISSVGSVCHAEDRPRSEEQRIAVAQELYSDAMEAFHAGEYEKAIEGFQAADALYPDPIFDYNIAVCWSALGEPMKALEAAERVADRDLPPENAVKNDARILAFRTARTGGQVARRMEVETRVPAPTEPSSPAWTAADTVAASIAGVGVVGLGATLWLNAEVARLADEVQEANRVHDVDRAVAAEEEGRSKRTAGRILGAASSVTLVTGVVWLVVRRLDHGSNDELTMFVGPTADGPRVCLRLRF